MKERMKKLTLLTFHREKEMVTARLQALGLIHIESANPMESEGLNSLRKERDLWKKTLEILGDYKSSPNVGNKQEVEDINEVRTQILESAENISQLNSRLDALKKDEHLLTPWGEFSWNKIKALKKQNIHFRFFAVPKKEFTNIEFGKMKEAAFEIISKQKGQVRFVVISVGENVSLPIEETLLPEKTLSEINEEKARISDNTEAIHQNLRNLSFAIPLFEEALATCNDKIAEAEAIKSYEGKAQGKIEVLKGWFPEKNKNEVLTFLKDSNLTYEVSNPGPLDKVPVILKNRRFPKIFETITKIFQLPNYYEFDLTPFIAVFYPLFFAYCLGDAGYGLILIIISMAGAFSFLKKMRGVALLGIILGLITMVTGIVKSGTLFGIPITENTDIPLFDFLSRYVLVTDDQDYIFNAFNVALMIGVIQIIVAVLISIVKKIRYEGYISSLGAFGKLLIIVSMIILFLGSMQKMELFIPYTDVAKILLILGIVLVLVFHNVQVSLAQRIGTGVLPLYFIFTGLLGDVLSYIRLFALGVASSILGLVVNQIGSQIMDGAGIIGISMAVLFLIFGHTVNFSLASLGAFVHPLRLTFVEFYNNAEFKGGGIEYRPLKKRITF